VTERLAAGYRDFAEHEAAGRSALYVELAEGVASDAEILGWLDGLAAGKRQPNLLFAAYRALAGTPDGWPEFRAGLAERRSEIEALMFERRTQTNEAARCALMLPLLAALPQPLALLEVGSTTAPRAAAPRARSPGRGRPARRRCPGRRGGSPDRPPRTSRASRRSRRRRGS
jgi:hypothetical protein